MNRPATTGSTPSAKEGHPTTVIHPARNAASPTPTAPTSPTRSGNATGR